MQSTISDILKCELDLTEPGIRKCSRGLCKRNLSVKQIKGQ